MKIFDDNFALNFGDVVITTTSENDFDGFQKIAFDSDIWSFTTGSIGNEEQLRTNIKGSLAELSEKKRAAFTIFNSGEIIGSTSYGNISVKDKRLEIGWTWIGKKYQGSGVNTICKFLLLQYAFEELKMERVEFKTDVLNLQSRKALKKIGATEEGVLRSHTLMHDSRRRNTIYYSILLNEWEDVKRENFAHLQVSPVK